MAQNIREGRMRLESKLYQHGGSVFTGPNVLILFIPKFDRVICMYTSINAITL